MTNHEGNAPESTPEKAHSTSQPNQSLEGFALSQSKTPEDARQEFINIKTALVGPEPEWCLPGVNNKAKASDKLDDSALIKSCQIFE